MLDKAHYQSLVQMKMEENQKKVSGILPDTGNVESEVHIHSLSLGKDKFNFSNKELVESSWKSPSQQRREEKRMLEHPKIKVAEKGAESLWKRN